MTDVAEWLGEFAASLERADDQAVAQAFAPDGLWRDVLAFGWTIATHEGRPAIARLVSDRAATVGATNWTTDAAPGATAGFIAFSTVVGRGRGYVRLKEGKCLTLLTSLEDIAGHEFPVGPYRPLGKAEPAGAQADSADPYVVIIGAGQSGLALGAALRLLGVPAILIDRHPRVGDQWRSRYKSLTLHDPVWYDHMPFLPFPDHWPVYTPKDKMGDWLEHYAGIMELDVWCSTECVSARRDEADGRWRVHLRRGGEDVVLHPPHVVMALGNAGFPRVPQFPGQDRFRGRQCHSSQHPGGEGLDGKRVVVVGANNSALDIAEDAVLHGAEVTMIQRSSTHIFHQASMRQRIGALYSEEAVAAGMTTDKADYINLSMPIRLQEKAARRMWDDIRAKEADYYARIEQAGFRLDFGVDGTGMQMKYLRAAAGYYIDVGATDLIVEGRIKVKAGEVREVVEDGIVLEDGTHLAADVIVYATGFGAMEEWVERLIGKDVADRLGRCWGYGSDTKGDPGPWEGEIRNMWKPTVQQGLWFMGGNLAQVRTFSRYLALQLKARFEGIDAEPYRP